MPWGLRPAIAVSASAVIVALLAWFLAELVTGGDQLGLAERVLGCAQALWPLLVVMSCRRSRSAAPGMAGLAAKERSELAASPRLHIHS